MEASNILVIFVIIWTINNASGDAAGEKIVDVSGSTDTVIVLNDKGDLFVWGQNEYGQALDGEPMIQVPFIVVDTIFASFVVCGNKNQTAYQIAPPPLTPLLDRLVKRTYVRVEGWGVWPHEILTDSTWWYCS